MLTGREMLGSIDQTLRQARDQARQAAEQIQATSEKVAALRREQAEHYRKLAEIRLDHLVGGQVVEALEVADRRVKELLEERQEARAALQGRIDGNGRRQSALEEQRRERSEELGQAAEELDRGEAAVQKGLRDDPAHQEQLAKARKAESVAAQAHAKTEQAEKDRAEKGLPYENDPLFRYLWGRRYGTSLYRANPLARLLDGWVARLCDYRDARPNYAMLLEIPKRLGEHSERVREIADGQFEELKRLEEEAARAGGVPALRRRLDEAQGKVDEADEQIRLLEEEARRMTQEAAAFAAGQDPHFRRALETLSQAMEREKLDALLRLARDTPAAADDAVVERLVDIEEEQEKLGGTLSEYRELHGRLLERAQQLEETRHRFKKERFDDVHSVFTDTSLLTMLLSQFLRGISTGDLWGTIKRHRRYRRIESDPNFGSGGFRRHPGTWRFPLPRPGGRGGPGGLGGRGWGGFRTGGGF